MHREDNSKFLLYIEPKKEEKLLNPVEDELTELLEYALKYARSGASSYDNLEKESFREGDAFKGTHLTECGERSANRDYLLENGMITNSLAPFYLKWYRNSIPKTELAKIQQLKEFYEV